MRRLLLAGLLLVAATVEAAPGSFTFPQNTYGPGVITLQDQNVQGSLNTATFTFDVTQHTNPAVVVTIAVEWSDDNGATWRPLGSLTRPGHAVGTGPDGLPASTSRLRITVPPAQPRRLRAIITITGGAIVTSGSLVWS